MDEKQSTLGIGMIVRNNGPHLEQLFEQIQRCGISDVAIVDTEPGGSKDGTEKLCSKYGYKYIQEDWRDDFGYMRNLSFDNVSSDWIMWLDSDDLIPERTIEFLSKFGSDESFSKFDGYFLQYEMWNNDVMMMSYPRERIISRRAFESGIRWKGEIHECMAFPQNSASVGFAIEHRPRPGMFKEPRRNLRILEKLYSRSPLKPRTRFYYARELYWAGQYKKAVKVFGGWLKTNPVAWEKYSGLIELARCHRNISISCTNSENAIINEDGYNLHTQRMLDCLIQAGTTIPSRAEAWFELGKYYYDKKEYDKAWPYFTMASHAVKPVHGFIEERCYTKLPWDYLAASLGHSGQYKEARRITESVLVPSVQKGSDAYDRYIKNIAFYNSVMNGTRS